MENIKNYKTYYINNKTWKTRHKLETIKELLKATKKDIENLEDWQLNRNSDYLTPKQFELLKNGDIKELKKLLKKQLEKEKTKLSTQKNDALIQYNNIKELKDIKRVTIFIEWSQRRLDLGAYQTRGTMQVYYQNGTYKQYQSSYTGGCGYDKPSTTMSELCEELLQIIPLKHYKKILNDEEKHYKFYALEPLYFQGGVGMSSYIQLFKNLGYKVKETYFQNENMIIEIEK